MKIVAILGSPHGPRGATGTLMAEVVRGAQDAGAAVSAISLSDQPVSPCRGCDSCHKTGVCPQKDAFNRIKAAMVEADGVILASPNYIVSVSAQMKALFDRCCGPLHCQLMQGKYGVAVETSGGTGGEEVRAYMLRFLRMLGCQTAGSIGAMSTELADAAQRQRVFAAAAGLGRALVDAIGKKTEFAEQRAERQAFFDRMKTLMQWRKDQWPFEYRHWQNRGWIPAAG